MTKAKYPGWRTMNAAQRHNARQDAIIDRARELGDFPPRMGEKPNAAYIEKTARKAGWFPTREAHVAFRNGDPNGVCRSLKGNETYQPDTDSYMSTPLRHADSWAEAIKIDKLI